jgi:urease accessory protein
MQLADSFFPSGMFSMSGGLESLVIHKKITNWEQVLNFIKEQIEFQLVPSDCVVLSITMDGVKNDDLEKVIHIDNKYYSMKLAKEVRNSTVRSGKQVFRCLKHMIGENKNKFFESKIESKETPCTYPVALGITAVCLELPIQSVMRILLYSFSSSVVSAAIRLGVIQHLDAQKTLMSLAEHVNNIILNLLTEIHQMKHEHNESKMFIT